jgi:hypothetical protein
MKVYRYLPSFAVVISLGCAPALAQPGGGSKTAEDENGIKVSETVSAGGPLDSNGTGTEAKAGLSIPFLQFVTEGEKVNAVFDIGYTTNLTRIAYRSSGDATLSATSDRFSLKANIPIAKTSKDSLFDIKGIANASTATLSYARYSTKYEEGGQTYLNIYNPAFRQCLVKESGTVAKRAVLVEYDKLLAKSKEQRGHFILETKIATQAQYKTAAGELATACGPEQFGDEIGLIDKFASPDDIIYLKNNIIEQHPVFFMGVDATLGYKKYEVLDRTAFLVGERGKFAYDGTAYAGVIGKRGDWSLKFIGSYTRSFKAPDTAQICRALTGTTQECISGPDGTPIKDESAYVAGEFKWLIPLGPDSRNVDGSRVLAKRIAIAPKVTLDVDESSWAVDLPVYLKADKAGKLNGGIRFGYRSDKDDFGVGLFVDVPFGDIF